MGRKVRVEEDATIDMTPMLDIVFIMLIFFIVTTVFVKEAGVEVNKPNGDLAVMPKNANIFIAVTEDGKVWIDKREVEVDLVRSNLERLMAEQPSDVIIIQADEEAEHGLVVEVMDQIKMAGIDRISIATAGS
ncbi:ExbD/TolR family protein [Paraglaciecola psychrophila]|jgi:biopolymer transport protein ExbD|uniref:Biopolymer transport protein ExbD/TolR n=1 Tax=Paraglaciecola psychrophila 170 TaxID=1129794 RepID=K6YZP3_9ALTE|nr:biopolymer transporter ExbD [Paraglaciecola psychrophila]AGH45714.1 biopolymer transport protein ExbD/TolR [Paraglaciecola psychrophila 170]GAC38234.1 biopolymer transport protein exbD2 [Paraglaciecola psychrophila 170]